MQEYNEDEIAHNMIESSQKQSLQMKLKEIEKKLRDRLTRANNWFNRKVL